MSSPASRVPPIIEGIALVHLACAPVFQRGFAPLVRDGLYDAVGGDPDREAAAWYALTGLGLLGFARLARRAVRETGHVPAQVGGWLTALGAAVTLLMPASGGWALFAAGGYALRAARRP